MPLRDRQDISCSIALDSAPLGEVARRLVVSDETDARSEAAGRDRDRFCFAQVPLGCVVSWICHVQSKGHGVRILLAFWIERLAEKAERSGEHPRILLLRPVIALVVDGGTPVALQACEPVEEVPTVDDVEVDEGRVVGEEIRWRSRQAVA